MWSYQVPELAGLDEEDIRAKYPRHSAGGHGIFSRAAAFGECPPGYFSPSNPALAPAPGTPIAAVKAAVAAAAPAAVKPAAPTTTSATAVRVASTTTKALAGYNAYGAPVVLHNSGGNMSGGIFRGSVNGLGDIDVNALLAQGKAVVDAGADALRNATKGQQKPQDQQAADPGILGIPTPIALAGGAIAAAVVFLGKRKNPGRRRKHRR